MESVRSYVHREIRKEVRSISGSLTVLDEIRLDYQGREVLCAVSVGVIDNSCCGAGGCLLIEVPGYVLSWDCRKTEAGQSVSQVVPVEDEGERREITAALNKLYPYAQIRFE